MSLSRLSNETLLQILSYFCLHCRNEFSEEWDSRPLQGRRKPRQRWDARSWYSLDRHALFSLSLSCKRFRDLAENVLYHEFVLGYGSSCASKLYSWNGRLVSFVRTVTRRPELAGLVKIVYLHPHLLESEDDDEKKTIMLEGSRNLGIDLPAAWRKRGLHVCDAKRKFYSNKIFGRDEQPFDTFPRSFLDEKAHLDTNVQQELYHASNGMIDNWLDSEFIAILTAQLPNLDHFSIRRASDISHPAFLNLGISRLPLKTLDLGMRSDTLVKLSAGLQTLNIDACNVWAPSSAMPSLKTLRITWGRLGPTALKDLLAACTGDLTAFEYEAAPYRDEAPSHFELSDAVQYLKAHKDSLKILHIDLHKKFFFHTTSDQIDAKCFSVLEHLALDSETIFNMFNQHSQNPGSDVLVRMIPSSIVSLSFLDGGNDRMDTALCFLAEYMGSRLGRFPNLRKVRYHGRVKSKLLRLLFSDVGVDFGRERRYLGEVKPYLVGFEKIILEEEKKMFVRPSNSFPLPDSDDDDL